MVVWKCEDKLEDVNQVGSVQDGQRFRYRVRADLGNAFASKLLHLPVSVVIPSQEEMSFTVHHQYLRIT